MHLCLLINTAIVSTVILMLLQLRQRQIQFGDRDVYFDDEGRKMSRLKHVDADWVLRRLERWGKRDNMPFIGPKKVWLFITDISCGTEPDDTIPQACHILAGLLCCAHTEVRSQMYMAMKC